MHCVATEPREFMPSPLFSSKPLVAIVEDNDQLRRAMSRVLETAGFKTKSFRSVIDFVNSGALGRIDCLVLDISLPGIDGLKLQECIRSTNYDLPIIFCSGTRSDVVKARAIAGGATCFLRKPVSSQELIEVVRAACKCSESSVDQPGPSVARAIALN